MVRAHSVRRLINFANKLDDLGLHREAIRVDSAAKEMASHELIIDPKFSRVFEDIFKMLASFNVNPQVIEAIKNLQISKYSVPAKPEEYIPEHSVARFVPEDARKIAMAYAQYYDSVQDLKKDLEGAKTNEERQSLQDELAYEERELYNSWQKLMDYKKKNQQVFELMREYINYALQHDKKPPEVMLMPERRSKDRRKQ